MRKILALAAVIAASASASGCATAVVGAGLGVGMAAVQDRTMGQVLDDGHTYADVKGRLMAADPTGFRDAHVEVYGANLLLSGSVPDEEHHRTALMVARTYPAVQNVYDELAVGEATGFVRAARDDLIAAQIRTRLTASPTVRAVNINIETFHGNVYLMGTARSPQELQRAAEIASTTPGVQRVVSFMQVVEARTSYAASAPPGPEYRAAPAPMYNGDGAPLSGSAPAPR